MDYRTLHENLTNSPLLSSIWITLLLTMLSRDVHEFLRDGRIGELATDDTVTTSTAPHSAEAAR